MKQRISRQLMLAFATFTLGVSASFGLFAMAFVYTVEDRFFDHLLAQEVATQQANFQANGKWAKPTSQFIQLHLSTATLPDDLGKQLAESPRSKEFFGHDNRHYHLAHLVQRGESALLVAEVSELLVVRPIRQELLGWLLGWGAAMVMLALILAWRLARRTSAPLEELVMRLNGADPNCLPTQILAQSRDDEIGALARGLDELMKRTRKLIEREQLFTGDVSHELRTPLAVLRMAIERLQTNQNAENNEHDLRCQLTAMHTATILMAQTVDTLLLLAREKNDGPVATVLILPLIEKWILANEVWLDRQRVTIGIQLTQKDNVALPSAVAQLVLANLLGNALVHGVAGGTIRIIMEARVLCITNSSADFQDVSNPARPDNHNNMVSGLGISIIQRLLERYSGTLTIDHQVGMTTVRVSIKAG